MNSPSPGPRTVRVSIRQHARDTAPPVVHELTWTALIETLSHYDFRTDKLAGPLFHPAELVGGAKIEHVKAVWFGVLDFDDVTPEAYMLALRKAEGLDAFSYTTWQQPQASGRGLFRGRLVVPFSRPVAPAEWPGVWARLVAAFGASVSDEQCKNANRGYFTPSLPVGADWAVQVWRALNWADGARAWDVDAALAAPFVAPEAGAGAGAAFVASDPIPKELVAALASKLSKRADPYASRVGVLIKAGLDGHAFAQPGQHDATIFSLACTLAEHFTHADPSALAEHFRLALQLMAQQSTHPGAPAATLENLSDKISRAQQKIHGEREATKQAANAGRSRKVALAFNNNRSHPYTPEELEQWSSDGALDGRWLVQRGNSVYLFHMGTYMGPFVRPELPSACTQFLAPASSAGVELYEVDVKGAIRLKSAEKLIDQYGRTVTDIEADMTAQRAYLPAGRHALIEAPCPLNPDLAPEQDADVATWLALLAGGPGGKLDALLDWIACVTRVDQPSPALYLMGQAGTGKTMLADGLARLWGRSPTSMATALSAFNDELARCPLVLADEKVPESWNGVPRTEELRELITRSEFQLNRKFQSLIRVKGSIRAILCANNLRLISSRENDFSPEDAQALADRFLFVCPSEQARAWLAERGGRVFTERFVEGNAIAKHALWLRDTRTIKRGTRLIVPGDSEELTKMLQSGTGVAWAVLSWIHSFLHEPARHVAARAGRAFGAIIRDGQIWIAPKLLLDSWEHYLPNERQPTLERLTNALRGLLVPVRNCCYRPRDSTANSGRTRYQALELSQLAAWCQAQGEDLNELSALLAVNTEELGTVGNAGPFKGLN